MKTNVKFSYIPDSVVRDPVAERPKPQLVPKVRPEEEAACEEHGKSEETETVPPWVARTLTEADRARPATKSWLQRWLSPDPPDPRKAARMELPWVRAYFFTGGKPEPHEVRDISATGLYVVTKERWYLDTVVRITLVDQRAPTEERSLTVHARVVRLGTDGAGLAFVQNERNARQRSKGRAADAVPGVDRERAEEFLRRVAMQM